MARRALLMAGAGSVFMGASAGAGSGFMGALAGAGSGAGAGSLLMGASAGAGSGASLRLQRTTSTRRTARSCDTPAPAAAHTVDHLRAAAAGQAAAAERGGGARTRRHAPRLRRLGISAKKVQEFCVWRNAPMRVLSSQGDLVNSYDPAQRLKEHRVLHCYMHRAVKRVLERQAARVLYRQGQTLPLSRGCSGARTCGRRGASLAGKSPNHQQPGAVLRAKAKARIQAAGEAQDAAGQRADFAGAVRPQQEDAEGEPRVWRAAWPPALWTHEGGMVWNFVYARRLLSSGTRPHPCWALSTAWWQARRILDAPPRCQVKTDCRRSGCQSASRSGCTPGVKTHCSAQKVVRKGSL